MGNAKEWWKVDGSLLDLDAAAARTRKKRSDKAILEASKDLDPLSITSLHELPNFIRPTALAKKLGCSAHTIVRDIRMGLLRARPHGASYLIDPAHVEAYNLLKTEQARKRRRSA